MAFAKTDSSNRIIQWSFENLAGYDTVFSNGEYIDQACVNGVDDFVIRDGVAYFEPTPEKQAEYERAAEQAEHQEIINSLPDALADLSLDVSNGAADTADLQDALADLSIIVNDLINQGA